MVSVSQSTVVHMQRIHFIHSCYKRCPFGESLSTLSLYVVVFEMASSLC